MIKVAVVAGGYSGEAEVSFKSAVTIMKYIDRGLFSPTLVRITKDTWVAEVDSEEVVVDRSDFSVPLASGSLKFDFVYVIVHGTPGEDGRLQSYLEMLHLPHSTGSALNMALTFNKGFTQQLLRSHGFRVADFFHFKRGDEPDATTVTDKLGLPCFVKPAQAGSSLGVSKVKEASQLAEAYAEVYKVDNEVMIESFLDGREITCGVFEIDGKVRALPVTEIVSMNEFFDYEAKYNDQSTQEITPAEIAKGPYQRCQELTVEIYKRLHCSGIVRVDYFLCGEDLFVMEVNGVPGMSEASIVPKMMRAADEDITEVLSRIINEKLKGITV